MKDKGPYFISIGSNVEPEIYIPKALGELRRQFGPIEISPVYETPPEGPAGDKPFWNLAVRVQSALPRVQAEEILRTIEDQMGRNRSADKYAPRTLDLDLLPRRGYQKQSFVMIPLADLAPDEKDEETGRSYGELARTHAEAGKAFKRIRLAGTA